MDESINRINGMESSKGIESNHRMESNGIESNRIE